MDILTVDNVRPSAWEIPSPTASDKTVIANHPLTTARFGSVKGLDDVSADFLPMVKHLHEAGYNIVMYDHCGQGDSDRVLDAQREKFWFGYAKALDDVPGLTVPVLYAQVEKDVYTVNEKIGRNDIQEIMDATPT